MKKLLLIASLFSVGGALGMDADVSTGETMPVTSNVTLEKSVSEQTQPSTTESVFPEVKSTKNMFSQMKDGITNFPKQAQERFASLTNQAKEGFANVKNQVGKKELIYVGAAVATVAVATLAYKLYNRKAAPKKAKK